MRTVTLQVTVKIEDHRAAEFLESTDRVDLASAVEEDIRYELRGQNNFDGWSVEVETIEVE